MTGPGRRDWPGPPPAGVVVDLDDTIFPQAAYLRGAAAEVGRAAAAAGLDGDAVSRALRSELHAGSDRGRTIDRALDRCGIPRDEAARVLPALVAAFAEYRPASLPLFEDAAAALAALRTRYPLACLTDGSPGIQRAKLAATRVMDAVDVVVITDELGGRALRKPHPAGMLRVADTLKVPVEELVMIGDRPAKDVATAVAVRARSIRVRTGEYAEADDDPPATVSVPDLATAASLLCSLAKGPDVHRAVAYPRAAR
jgi:FMN phosphatase YigB (HAD superfamily)